MSARSDVKESCAALSMPECCSKWVAIIRSYAGQKTLSIGPPSVVMKNREIERESVQKDSIRTLKRGLCNRLRSRRIKRNGCYAQLA